MKNNNEIINVLGIKRAGNHFIINMLIKNILNYRSIIWGPKYNDIYSPTSTPPRYALIKEIGKINEVEKPTSLLLSYEHLPLAFFKDLDVVKSHKILLPNSVLKNILILRDPFNFIASYLRLLDNYLDEGLNNLPLLKFPLSEVKKLWISYAYEYIGKTRYIDNVNVINYNEWVRSKTYRDDFFLNVFGLKNKDEGLNEVLSFGGGSSFDRMKYNQKGSFMKTLNRWELYSKDKRFLSFIIGEDIEKLAREIYPKLSRAVYNNTNLLV